MSRPAGRSAITPRTVRPPKTELKTGEVLYREPLTHAAENIGTTTMHLILVELKTPAR